MVPTSATRAQAQFVVQADVGVRLRRFWASVGLERDNSRQPNCKELKRNGQADYSADVPKSPLSSGIPRSDFMSDSWVLSSVGTRSQRKRVNPRECASRGVDYAAIRPR